MLSRLRRTLAAVLFLLPAASAFAAVPSTLGYQGLLADGGGSPVPTGSYDLNFALYDVSSGGAALWTEAHPGVGVVNGSFAVTLGSSSPLTAIAFDKPLWLGISIGAAPELSPRVELAASPYALGLRVPTTLASNDTTTTLTVSNPAGVALRVDNNLYVHRQDVGGFLRLDTPANYPGVIVRGAHGLNPGVPGVEVWPVEGVGALSAYLRRLLDEPRSGDLYIAGGETGNFVRIRGSYAGTTSPRFEVNGTASDFRVHTHLSGDSAVMLAAGSIGPAEMSGVPGISHTEAGLVTLGATMGPVVATTITTPRDGYIRVTAGGEVRVSGTVAPNTVVYQITTSPTAVEDTGVSRATGFHQYVGTGWHFFTASAERIYFLPAGTHTFHFQARRDAAPGGVAGIQNPTITASFFPVSYGSVVSSLETGETADLRQLELRALQARLEAERAERALELARAKEEETNLEPAIVAAGSGR